MTDQAARRLRTIAKLHTDAGESNGWPVETSGQLIIVIALKWEEGEMPAHSPIMHACCAVSTLDFRVANQPLVRINEGTLVNSLNCCYNHHNSKSAISKDYLIYHNRLMVVFEYSTHNSSTRDESAHFR